MAKNERPEPIKIANKDTGKTYILEYNRLAVRKAEREGFEISSFDKKTYTCVEDLFYHAFYMHHGNEVTREKAAEMINELGGLPSEVIERLVESYAYTLESLAYDEEKAKNSKWVVSLK